MPSCLAYYFYRGDGGNIFFRNVELFEPHGVTAQKNISLYSLPRDLKSPIRANYYDDYGKNNAISVKRNMSGEITKIFLIKNWKC
jgi:hypothetical protein